METVLNKDLIIYLAFDLDYPDILSLCKTSKKLNLALCKNETFWENKIRNERPGLLELYEINKKVHNIPNYTYRTIYDILMTEKGRNSISWTKKPLEIYGVIEGSTDELGFEYLSDLSDYFPRGTEGYAIVSNSGWFAGPYLAKTQSDAIDMIMTELIDMINDEDAPQLAPTEQYMRNELMKHNRFELWDNEFLMKKFTVV